MPRMKIAPETSPQEFEKHYTKLVSVPDFRAFKPGQELTVYLDREATCNTPQYQLTVYPDGHDSDTQGSVSIILRKTNHLHLVQDVWMTVRRVQVELTCTFSVVDAEGCRRLPQSFAFSMLFHEMDSLCDRRFVIDNYVSREFLLENPSELLPSDTLTLQLEIVLRERELVVKRSAASTRELMQSNFTVYPCPGGPRRFLNLDSTFAEVLRKESMYFERMLETPTAETFSRRMNIPEEEYESFLEIAAHLMYGLGIGYPAALDAYAVAHKYFIESVLETCRSLFKSIICEPTVSDISALADQYGDDYLKKVVEIYQREEENEANVTREDDAVICEMKRCKSGVDLQGKLPPELENLDRDRDYTDDFFIKVENVEEERDVHDFYF